MCSFFLIRPFAVSLTLSHSFSLSFSLVPFLSVFVSPSTFLSFSSVNCPSGSYSTQINGVTECKLCPIGEYKDTDGNQTCTPCPANKSTYSEGSIHVNDCKGNSFYISSYPANLSKNCFVSFCFNSVLYKC